MAVEFFVLKEPKFSINIKCEIKELPTYTLELIPKAFNENLKLLAKKHNLKYDHLSRIWHKTFFFENDLITFFQDVLNDPFFTFQTHSPQQIAQQLKTFITKINNLYKNFLSINTKLLTLKPQCIKDGLKNFQADFIVWSLDKFNKGFRALYLMDDMGLGKTIQSLYLIKTLNINKAFVLCPLSLKETWKLEAQKWIPNYQVIDLTRKTNNSYDPSTKTLYILNYDRILNFIDNINKKKDENALKAYLESELVIADEATNLKNLQAKRVKILLNLAQQNPNQKYLFLSGTPLVNNPADLFPFLVFANIFTTKDYLNFVNQFCEIKEITIKKGKTTKTIKKIGPLKQGEEQNLQKLLAPFYLRREKEQVLHELPQKLRFLVYLETTNEIQTLLQKELTIFKLLKNKENLNPQIVKNFIESNNLTLNHENIPNLHQLLTKNFSEIRHQLGQLKIASVINYITELLSEYPDKYIIVCGWHTDILQQITQKLSKTFPQIRLLTGQTSETQRAQYVKEFQDGKLKILVMNIKVGGFGLNLTTGTDMIFAELPLTIAEILQAEDRLHRIGQTKKPLYHYLIYPNSLDQHILNILHEKDNQHARLFQEKENLKFHKKIS